MKVENITNKDLLDQIKALYTKNHKYVIELHSEDDPRVVGESELDWIVSTLTADDELHIPVPPGEVITYNDHDYCGPCMIVYRVFESR